MPHLDYKHRAKRWNERIKLVATAFNSIAIVTVAAAFITPIANKHYDVLADGFCFWGRSHHIWLDR